MTITAKYYPLNKSNRYRRMFKFITTSLLFLVPCLVQAQNNIPPLPEPVANNAVATVNIDQQQYLLSFMGLGQGKGHKDVHNRAW